MLACLALTEVQGMDTVLELSNPCYSSLHLRDGRLLASPRFPTLIDPCFRVLRAREKTERWTRHFPRWARVCEVTLGALRGTIESLDACVCTRCVARAPWIPGAEAVSSFGLRNGQALASLT